MPSQIFSLGRGERQTTIVLLAMRIVMPRQFVFRMPDEHALANCFSKQMGMLITNCFFAMQNDMVHAPTRNFCPVPLHYRDIIGTLFYTCVAPLQNRILYLINAKAQFLRTWILFSIPVFHHNRIKLSILYFCFIVITWDSLF